MNKKKITRNQVLRQFSERPQMSQFIRWFKLTSQILLNLWNSRPEKVKIIFQECGVLSDYSNFIPRRIAFDHEHIFEFCLNVINFADLHQNLDEVEDLVILGLCLTQI